MAWNLSTGAKNALLGQASTLQLAKTAITLSFEDGTGTGGRDRIVDSANGLASFADYVYDTVGVEGSTSNDGNFVVLAAAAGYIEVAAGSFSTEAAGDQVILSVSRGGSFAEIFRNCVMDLYSGSRPTDADQTENGTKLCRITLNGGAFVSGSPTNGINFGQTADGAIELAVDPATGLDQALSGDGLVTGSALFARVYANTVTTGASTSAVRMDGRVAVSGAEVNMSAGTTVTAGVDVDITSVSFNVA